jgi:hypothetical protein
VQPVTFETSNATREMRTNLAIERIQVRVLLLSYRLRFALASSVWSMKAHSQFKSTPEHTTLLDAAMAVGAEPYQD